ncbi:ATP-binding protein [Alteromonas sp. ALT199]|uniref:sensor histidine kinase n=1 Tax=unclassified Alteromonas TaxID=2614992 RepID=UPI001BE6C3FA|nr:ATP-binding protein [Alteromonas sp. ALT199]MBT3134476.1 ATP-binding protein [Alteromonas sp. ALT199]
MSETSYSTENERIRALEARVNSLERQLKRQKIARKNAESFLETYSQDAYLANQALRTALNDSKKRERELLYLNRTASQLTQATSGDSYIFSALESAVEFSGAFCGKAFTVKDGELIIGNDDSVLVQGQGWITSHTLAQFIQQETPLDLRESYSHWCVSAVMQPEIDKESRLLHFMHEMSKGEYTWLVLLTKDDNLEEETLYVLDTTKHYLDITSRYHNKKSELNTRQLELSNIKKDRDFLEERLVSADKMAMLGQLAAGIAHEINNPIGYVRSNTVVAKDIFNDYQRALEEIGNLCQQAGGEIEAHFLALENRFSLKESAAEIAEMFDESHEGIERIIEIVKALRSFSYPGSGKHSKISAIDAMNTAIKLTNNLHRYRNTVLFEIPDEDAFFNGNSGQIQQVLVNFLTNAIYATPEGKGITLRVKKEEDSVSLVVEDEGMGMSKETLSKVFTPFFTTKPPGEGTGLGMSISMTIVEEHNGRIDIVSAEGRGTKVSVVLPLA